MYVGGFSEPDQTDRVDEDHEHVKKMTRDAKEFFPDLDTDHRDSAFPLGQGLRPARIGDVRVERELRPRASGTGYSRIVHCYGHAGAGWSLAFGSALEVKTLVEDVLDQLAPTPMHATAASAVSQVQVAHREENGALEKPVTNGKSAKAFQDWLVHTSPSPKALTNGVNHDHDSDVEK